MFYPTRSVPPNPAIARALIITTRLRRVWLPDCKLDRPEPENIDTLVAPVSLGSTRPRCPMTRKRTFQNGMSRTRSNNAVVVKSENRWRQSLERISCAQDTNNVLGRVNNNF